MCQRLCRSRQAGPLYVISFTIVYSYIVLIFNASARKSVNHRFTGTRGAANSSTLFCPPPRLASSPLFWRVPSLLYRYRKVRSRAAENLPENIRDCRSRLCQVFYNESYISTYAISCSERRYLIFIKYKCNII